MDELLIALLGLVFILGSCSVIAWFVVRTMKKRNKEKKEIDNAGKDNKMEGNNYVYSEK